MVPPRCSRSFCLSWRMRSRCTSHVSAPHRCNLASVLLQLLAMKVPNVLTFDFMSKPSPGRQHLQWSSGGLGG